MTEVTMRRGGVVIPAEELTSADQDTITGDGTVYHPLVAAGGGGSAGTPFRYVATGDEGNPFTVPLPAARANTNYNIQLTLMRPTGNNIKVPSVVDGSLTLTGFDVECTVALQLGDTLLITVEDL